MTDKLAKLNDEDKAIAKMVAKKLFAEGAEKVYVALGGERIYIGREPATKFVDREGTPENIELLPSDVS
jgi:hypothetical protein